MDPLESVDERRDSEERADIPPPASPLACKMDPPSCKMNNAAAPKQRGRALSARPHKEPRFASRLGSDTSVPSMPTAVARARGQSDARARARAQSEARIREFRTIVATHTEILAKREVEAVKQSFEEDRQGRRCPVINPYDAGIRWWELLITIVVRPRPPKAGPCLHSQPRLHPLPLLRAARSTLCSSRLRSTLAQLCYQAVEMPLRLAFGLLIYSEAGLIACRWVESGIDLLFVCDLFLNFFISYLDDDMQAVYQTGSNAS